MAETMRDIYLGAARRYARRPAVVAGDRSLTYAELVERSVRLANALHGHGLVPGDRVAAMLEDRLESLEVHLAAAIGGLTLVPVNHRFVAREVDYLVADSGARAFVHTDGLTPIVATADGPANCGPIITIGSGDCPPGARRYEALLADASAAVPDVPVTEEDFALIGYTSGTTGFPKGAMITHRAQVAGFRNQAIAYRLPMFSRLAFSGSLSFVALLNSFIYPHFFVGGTVTLVGELAMDRWEAIMARDRSHVTYLPTPLIPEFTTAAQERPDAFASLETVVHSASRAPAHHVDALVDAIGDRFVEAYGMTEIQVAATALTRDDVNGGIPRPQLCETVGRATPAAMLWAVDADGQRLPPGAHGEIVIQTHTAFSGYWNLPEKTAEVLRDGVYASGDMGRVDADGYCYLEGGRRNDMIISGGMNVYPVEVEAELSRHPDVVDCSVFGVADDRWGEAVTAAVVIRDGAHIDADSLDRMLREQLAAYKVPKRIVFVEDMPRTTSLKVKKHALREQLGLPAPERHVRQQS